MAKATITVDLLNLDAVKELLGAADAEIEALRAENERLKGEVAAGIQTEKSSNETVRRLLREARAEAEELREQVAVEKRTNEMLDVHNDTLRRWMNELRACLHIKRVLALCDEADAKDPQYQHAGLVTTDKLRAAVCNCGNGPCRGTCVPVT